MTDKRINKLKETPGGPVSASDTGAGVGGAAGRDLVCHQCGCAPDVSKREIASTLASWLERLDDNSLGFALCHQLMHIRLGHLSRPQFYKGDRFHFACNIVVNSSLIRYDFTDDKLPWNRRDPP